MKAYTESEPLQLEVVIEIPRGSFLKRGYLDHVEFISPFPCPYNYGAVHDYIGLDGDFLDALVLGPRLSRGSRVNVNVFGAIGLTDRDMYDDKLICSMRPFTESQRMNVLQFFQFYGRCKKLLNTLRGRHGVTRCEGWRDAREAISRAHRRKNSNGIQTVPIHKTPF